MRATQGLLITILVVLCFFITGCGDNNSNETSESFAASVGNSKNACNVIGLPRIINGESCGGIQNAAVVRVMAIVQRSNGFEPVPICTGSLIGANVVLTAAHCFIPDYQGAPVVGLAAYIGEPGIGQLLSGVAYSIAPSYSFNAEVGRLFDDAAIFILEASVSNPVLPILTSRVPQIGEPGFVYGYGLRNEGIGTGGDDFFTLEAGQMTVANVTPNHIFVSFDGSGTNVCNGDSGGPIVVLADGGPALIGITSQGTTAGCSAGDITTFTNIHSPGVFNWLLTSVPVVFTRSAQPVEINEMFVTEYPFAP